MKRLILFLSCFLLLAIRMQAASYTPESLPMVYLQDRTRHVVNPDGILSAECVAAMDTLLWNLEQNKGVQSVVAVVESIENDNCYEFCMQLARLHGIGSKANTGLIILLSTQNRCYQILTGTGLEGTLPDAICRRIENQKMVPFLKEGNWDQAMYQTVYSVCKVIEGDPTLINELTGKKKQEGGNTGLYFVGAVILLFILISWYSNRQRNTCPHCGKQGLVRMNSNIIVDRIHRVEHHQETFRCPHCGQLTHRKHDEPMDNGTGFGGMVPPIMGPWGGFHRGGSSFDGPQGGSFEGGDFGGGGSGGEF